MHRRVVLRRAFPYLVIGIGGFALAYAVIYLFVLPSRFVPPPQTPFVPDSTRALRPIDTSTVAPSDTAAPIVADIPFTTIRAPIRTAVQLPDLTGMALPDARTILNGLRLATVVRRDTSSLQPPNTVLAQQPPPSDSMLQTATVTLTVSYLPPDTLQRRLDSARGAFVPAGRDTPLVQRGAALPPIRLANPNARRTPPVPVPAPVPGARPPAKPAVLDSIRFPE